MMFSYPNMNEIELINRKYDEAIDETIDDNQFLGNTSDIKIKYDERTRDNQSQNNMSSWISL